MFIEEPIKGKTVLLRSAQVSDAEVTYMMRTDPQKTQFIHRAQGTVEDQKNFIIKQLNSDNDYLFVFEDYAGKVLGMKGLYNWNRVEKTIESGRFLGYGSSVQNMEALLLGFDFAFYELGVKKVEMAALETNSVMIGIQTKLGVEFTHDEFLEEFGCKNIHSVLTEENYEKNKIKIVNLINRFANR